jgi:glycosyltransferase involved in cell wall biosynthesis
MLTNPIVTILVPIHGSSPFLEETLQSIKRVSYEQLEILLILDRPGTQARELAVEFCLDLKNARYLESKEPGISAALNYGIQKSTGELIARLDADDRILPSRITMQVNEFNKVKNLVLVGTQMRIIDSRGRHIRFTSYPLHNRQIKALLEVRNCVGHPSVMYKKKAVEIIGGYRSEYNGAEDLDLWLRLAHEGKFKIINLPLTEYRISDFQETNKLRLKPGALEEKVILSYWQMRSQNLSKSRLFSKSLRLQHSEGIQFSIPFWKIGQLRCIRSLWRAEDAFQKSRLKGAIVVLKGSIYSPLKFAHFVRYFMGIKLNLWRQRWK